MKNKTQKILVAISALTFAAQAFAEDVVDERLKADEETGSHFFSISPYEPNYALPFYYTQKPDYQVYNNNTPDDQSVKKVDVKFQFSFKVPIAHNLFNRKSDLYFAYTQLNYWEAYNNSAFMRENDFAPEIFLANYWDKTIFDGWHWKLMNYGFIHQSNGKGGSNERSWDRFYGEGVFAKNQWMVTVKPWYVFHDGAYERYNPDMANYLGYGEVTAAYKYHGQVFSLMAQNEAESRFRRGAETATWSFPLTKHFKGYLQIFSGYGQSLMEYNHYTNSAGVGIALNDWI